MIRVLSFSLVVFTGLIGFGVYRVAEEARITALELRETRTAIAQENQSLTVLGAEWARLTQPARIQALAEKHLNLSSKPPAQVASLSRLPPKDAPDAESAIRNANAVVPQVARALVGASAVSLPNAQMIPVTHSGT